MDEFDCRKCKGTGGIIYRTVNLTIPCGMCGATGKVDWIENITRTSCHPLDKDDYRKFITRNIHILTAELVEVCRKLDIYARIEFIPFDTKITRLDPYQSSRRSEEI